MPQSLHLLNGPLLYSLQYPLPRPAGNTAPNAAQDATGLLSIGGTLLALGQPGVHKDPQGLFCKAAFQPVSPLTDTQGML